MEKIKIFSIRIKQLRESLEMTQKEFSERIGVKQQTLSGYERGIMTPPLDVVKGVAEEFHVSIDWLCGLSDNKNIGNEIKTYSDVIDILWKLEKTELGLIISDMPTPDIPPFKSALPIPAIAFNNVEMYEYLYDFAELLELKRKHIVKDDWCEFWIASKKDELDKQICYFGIPETFKHMSSPDE